MLSQVPFVKIVFPFILGIIWAIQFSEFSAFSLWFLLVSLLSLTILTFLKSLKHFHNLQNLIFLSTILFLGAWLTSKSLPKIQKSQLNTNACLLYASVSEIPQIKSKTVKLKVRIYGIYSDSKYWKSADEIILVYLSKKIKAPSIGDYFLIKCSLNKIPEPENPFQFNYKEFLKWQGIHFQTFVNDNSHVLFTGKNRANLIQTISSKGTTYLNQIIRSNIKDTIAAGVTESLLFGFKDDISKDLVNSYAHTGTLHVLAVSGMHVAIVFLMFAQMLWFLDRLKHGKWFKAIIVMAAIWGYCILTGLAPSILRAGFMISLILVGKAINRRAQVFNLMAVSAFVILVINPFWIINVGFQLSFAAVAGIVYLQSYVLPLYTPPNRVLKEIWNILAISICAQITTFPISLYYFNQFPNYFLISNLLVIPLSTLVIYSGVCMVLFSKVPFLLNISSWITEKVVLLTNFIVSKIEALPYSYTDGIKLCSIQLALLYFCILAVIFWLIKQQKIGFFLCLFALTAICGITFYDRVTLQRRNSIVFFNIPAQNAILLSDGRRSALIVDSSFSNQQLFYMRGWLINNRLWPINKVVSIEEIHKGTASFLPLEVYSKKDILFFKSIKLRLSLEENNLERIHYTYVFPKTVNLNQQIELCQTDTLIIGQTKKNFFSKEINNLLVKMPFGRRYLIKKSGFKVKYF